MAIVDITYIPANEQPRPRTGSREFSIDGRVYVLIPGSGNLFTPEAIAILEASSEWSQLLEWGCLNYSKETNSQSSPLVVPSGGGLKPEELQTPAARTKELEAIYAESGYKKIEELAAKIGVTNKPPEGWKSLIPAIVDWELTHGELKN